MEKAIAFKGDQDVHVLRELAFLYLWTGDPIKAKTYINKAVGKARNNSYILELQVLIELAFGKGYVLHNETAIEGMIDVLESIGFSNGYAFRVKVEYRLSRGETAEARELFNLFGQQGVVNKLLDAKILIAEKRYSSAVSILDDLRKKILDSKDSQRRSILPLIADLLIQASSGVSVTDGILAYRNNQNYLAKKIRVKTNQELVNQAAYSKYKISHEEKAILGI